MIRTFKIILFNLIILIILLFLLEQWVKWNYRREYGAVKRPVQVIYPPSEINGFADHNFTKNKPDSVFRILCLGASTSIYANYPEFIKWAFKGQPYILTNDYTVEVYSTGNEAHTSLDSYYKYRWLYQGYDFDLVIFYHGINDLRANNCPPEMFKNDYSHFSYYSIINPAMKLLEIPVLKDSFLAMKVVLTYNERRRKWLEKSNDNAFIPQHAPKEEWLKFGNVIRTRETFYSNVEKIIKLAHQRGQRVLLMTFASCIPDEYTLESFERGELGYAEGMDIPIPVELFGTVENVRKGLEVHNQVIRELARRKNTYFIDQAKKLNCHSELFIDVCHFSQKGMTRFAGWIGNYFMHNRFKPIRRHK